MSRPKHRCILAAGVTVLAFSVVEVAGAAPQFVDRDKFFASARSKHPPNHRLTQEQVEGYELIIQYWESRPELGDPRWLAYALATALHETKMQPVREGFCKTDQCSRDAVKNLWLKGRIKRNYAASDPNTGLSYYGRGYTQLTHADKYKAMGKELGLGDKLYLDPDLALDPKIAGQILWVGMFKGLFRTDKKGRRYTLGRFFNAGTNDWTNAREIINGDTHRIPKGDSQGLGKRIGGNGRFYLTDAIRLSSAPLPVTRPQDLNSGIIANDEPPPEVAPTLRPRPAVPAGQAQGGASIMPEPSVSAAALDQKGDQASGRAAHDAALRTVAAELRKLSEQVQSLADKAPESK